VFFAVMPTSTENACLSNVHNLAMAMGMYAADDNAHLPPAARWPEALSAYVYDRSTFSCSMDGVHEPEVNGPMDASYSMNRYLGGASWSTAASLPLLFDGLALRGDKTTAAFRHAGGLNVSYADGHAQWLSRKAFLDGSLKPKTQP